MLCHWRNSAKMAEKENKNLKVANTTFKHKKKAGKRIKDFYLPAVNKV